MRSVPRASRLSLERALVPVPGRSGRVSRAAGRSVNTAALKRCKGAKRLYHTNPRRRQAADRLRRVQADWIPLVPWSPALTLTSSCPLLLVLSVLFIPFLAARASGQTAATISGTVDDPNRSVLPGVTVTVRNVDTALSPDRRDRSRSGRYVIPGLPRATTSCGPSWRAKPHVRRGLQLTVAQALVVNITLEVGGLSEEVTVTGDTPLVNTSSAELSYLVGADTIDALPLNGRNYTDLALLQPGVLPSRTATADRSSRTASA